MEIDARNEKKKVLALIWDLGNGGAQQIVINNLRFFKYDPDIDYKLVVFCGPSGSKYDKIVADEHLNVEYLGYPKSKIRIPIIRYPFNKVVEYNTWKKVIEFEKPDLVHVHISELLTTTLWAINKCDVPVKFDTLHSNPYRYKGYALWCIKRAFVKYGFIPVCLNELQAQQAKDHYGISRYEIVHNGIDFSSIREKIISKEEAREKLKIPQGAFVLAGVGRLDPIKNYELMIDVFSKVSQSKEDALLFIAGGGDMAPLMDRVKTYGIADKVKFLGHINNVTDLYCAADVLLMTSHSEASSLTLIEAQTCGIRAVVSKGVPKESVITPLVSQIPEGSTLQDWNDVILYGGHEVHPVLKEKDYELAATNFRIKELYMKYLLGGRGGSGKQFI